MVAPKQPAQVTQIPRLGIDLYYSARPTCPFPDGNTPCRKTGAEHTERSDSDSMHRNEKARWTSLGCEKLSRSWVTMGGGAHCPIYKWEMIDSLEALVKSVEKRCGDHSFVRVLRLKGHGNGGRGFWVVNDAIDKEHLDNSPVTVSHLQKLASFLVPGKSLILLEHCKAGRAEKLLKRLSSMFGGVAIMASKEDQLSHAGRPRLESQIWDDEARKYIDVKFVVCNATTCINVDPMEPKDLAVHLMKKSREQPGKSIPMYERSVGSPYASGFVDVPSEEATRIIESGT